MIYADGMAFAKSLASSYDSQDLSELKIHITLGGSDNE